MAAGHAAGLQRLPRFPQSPSRIPVARRRSAVNVVCGALDCGALGQSDRPAHATLTFDWSSTGLWVAEAADLNAGSRYQQSGQTRVGQGE
jgi:hypothetical protein